MNSPVHLYDSVFIPEELQKLRADGYKDFYGFVYKNFAGRTQDIAEILKECLDKSNQGEKLSIDDALTNELKRLLASVCYLLNSSSYRDGQYYGFDRDEIDRKLGRKK